MKNFSIKVCLLIIAFQCKLFGFHVELADSANVHYCPALNQGINQVHLEIKYRSRNPKPTNFQIGDQVDISCPKHFKWVKKDAIEISDSKTFDCTPNGWKREDGLEFPDLECQIKCGIPESNNSNVFTSGAQVDWPWHVGIFKGNNYLCDGSLISPSGAEILVVSAAHCFERLTENSLKLLTLKVVIGGRVKSQGIDSVTGNVTQTFYVALLQIHPNYKKEIRQNDIAILATQPQILPTDFSLPVCLPTRSTSQEFNKHQAGRIVGTEAGTMHGNNKKSSWKYHATDVPLILPEVCGADASENKILPSQFCGGKFNETLACLEYSKGVGLVFPETLDESSKLKFTIQGIASSARGSQICGVIVYTRVSSYIDWIVAESQKLLREKTNRMLPALVPLPPTTTPKTQNFTFQLDRSGFSTWPGNNSSPHKDSHTMPKSSLASAWLVPLSMVSIVLILTLGMTILCWKIYMHRQTMFSKQEFDKFINGCQNTTGKHSSCTQAGIEAMPYDLNYEITEAELEIDRSTILGYGEYGIVFQGKYKQNQVAIKTLKAGTEKEYMLALLSELKVMIYLKNHQNLVSLVGAYTKSVQRGILYIVVDLCPMGSLVKYLRKHRDSFEDDCFEGIQTPTESSSTILDNNIRLSTRSLLIWAYEICAAMEYLECKKVIHADLAARNVLLTDRMTAKVSDFGLSRQLFEHLEYVKKHQEPMPWRWMAPESLQMLHFSSQSDVWSFGVTLWEIFTLGDVPYPGLAYTVDFPIRISEGLRLYKPPYASSKIHELMTMCWDQTPRNRPSFSVIKVLLLDVLNTHLNLEEYTHLEFS